MSLMLAVAQNWCPWCGDHMAWGGWGMMFGWVLVLVVVLLLLWAVASGRWRGDRGDGGTNPDGRTNPGGAEDVLRERYARGEIDEETYRRRLNELRRD